MPPVPVYMPPIPVCLIQAADEYSLPPRVLVAMLLTEGGQIGSVSKNKDGTLDHGPFQINTVWTRRLEVQFGVTASLITRDFCWSARAAAYIVRYEINRANGSFWDGVGHYHSHTPEFKYPYIQRVYLNSLKF